MDNLKNYEYMTLNSLVIVLTVLLVVGGTIYFYQSYKKIKSSIINKELKNYTKNQCPDYWDIVKREKDDKGREYVECKNTHKLGLCALDPERNTFTFDDEIFVNNDISDLSRCKWAKQCGVSWTGYNNICS